MFLKGPRYKATEGFKASKTVLAWVGCRSSVTRHKEAYSGTRLERGVIKLGLREDKQEKEGIRQGEITEPR